MFSIFIVWKESCQACGDMSGLLCIVWVCKCPINSFKARRVCWHQKIILGWRWENDDRWEVENERFKRTSWFRHYFCCFALCLFNEVCFQKNTANELFVSSFASMILFVRKLGRRRRDLLCNEPWFFYFLESSISENCGKLWWR